MPGGASCRDEGRDHVIIQDVNANEALLAALRHERFVPDKIDAFAGAELSAKYGGVPVSPGGKLSVAQTANAPELEWPLADDESASYTVLMFDVDAPSRSASHGLCWLHWAVGDVPGLDIARGSEIVPYAGPTPPAGSGPHRYVLVVYRQAEEMGVRQLGRPKFDPLRFAHSQALEPVAANFFVAENE
ncbi:YbhB/YbcL family Raf kinase inhibitor-like protein [Nocardia amikacinitolerans]|uniref:YbhB/YbcL family Raf kinase inhibitor-like protein n=1 Tax=Nocardia amikacinitolerans TaxID=756689 RepID=UPI0015C8763E|nr:YbhB/YbcL family Raf kinase inhibitor-like protein [Nocardia amikacinitolerans]